MVESAKIDIGYLRIDLKEKDSEISRLNKELEANRMALYSNQCKNDTNEQFVGLQIENMNLQSQVKNLRKMMCGTQPTGPISDLNLERDLAVARDNENRLQLIIQERETQIQQLRMNIPALPQDVARREIQTLIDENENLKITLSKAKQDTIHHQENNRELRSLLNSRDQHIWQLQDTSLKQEKDIILYKGSSQDYTKLLDKNYRQQEELDRIKKLLKDYQNQISTTKSSYSNEDATAIQNAMDEQEHRTQAVEKMLEKERDKVIRLENTILELSTQNAQLKNRGKTFGTPYYYGTQDFPARAHSLESGYNAPNSP